MIEQSLNYLNPKEDIDGYVIGHLFVADDYGGLLSIRLRLLLTWKRYGPVVDKLNKPNLNLRFQPDIGWYHTGRKENGPTRWIGYQKADDAALVIKDQFQSLRLSEEGIAACYLNLGLLPKGQGSSAVRCIGQGQTG